MFFGKTILAKALKEAKIDFDKNEAHSALYDTKKTAELLCSLEQCDTNLFVVGFTYALQLFCKKIRAYRVIMDESSANIIVCNYLSKVNTFPFLITNGAYYFYNYISETLPPSKCFILS